MCLKDGYKKNNTKLHSMICFIHETTENVWYSGDIKKLGTLSIWVVKIVVSKNFVSNSCIPFLHKEYPKALPKSLNNKHDHEQINSLLPK